MSISKLKGKIQTVTGLIDPENLGITLPHEHLFADLSPGCVIPAEPSEKQMANKPVSFEILHWLRYHPNENIDNMQLLDEDEAIYEAMLFKKTGGNSIVDVTSVGAGRDPKGLRRVSMATGLNIIMGSGYYLGEFYTQEMLSKTEEDITDEILRDITEGVGHTDICAGLIGEIGCTWPLMEVEKKSLRAAARAQKSSGAALNIHLGRNREAAFEILEILTNAGADLNRVILSHVDIRMHDHNLRCKVAEMGCYVEYDLWGWEGQFPISHYWQPDLFYQPNDTRRIYEIMQLIEAGYLKQILISHDVCIKSWRASYGGKGLDHIPNDVVPRMLRAGVTQDQITEIMVENPKRILSYI
jgi:phosphotriesterase-related protein